jgi:catechol 2,3-dioxygenase-like lactoylglutathione lyase family enzyme
MITAIPRIAIAVPDFAQAVSVFRDSFGMPVQDYSSRTVTPLGAHVGMCVPLGGSNIELMAPANPALPLSQALQKFLNRRGQGPYAMMLEAPDPNAEADDLLQRGVKVLPLMAGAGGRDVHPSSTHGVLVRVYPENSAPPPAERPSDELGLSGIDRTIIATLDVSLAAQAYGAGLGLEMDDAVIDPDRGVLAARGRAPAGGDIELVSIVDSAQPFAQAIGHHLDQAGEGIFALGLLCDDPAQAASVLAQRGLNASDPGSGQHDFTVLGTRFILQQRTG